MKYKIFTLVFLILLAGCQTTPPPTATPAEPTATRPPPTATLVPTNTPEPVVRSEPKEPLDPFAQAERLGRGVNLGNALEGPKEGEWGVMLEEEYFVLIKEGGFDTVRVPIRWSAHAEKDEPYTIDEKFFERIDWVLDNSFKNDLNVVINMHHYDGICASPRKHWARFLGMWRQIATRYRNEPDNLYLEPLNEPHDNLTPSEWNKLLAEVVQVIREVDGVHTIVMDGAYWGNVEGLKLLRPPEGERNVIGTFHSYSPFLFTHQGAEWSGDEYSTLGVIWPGPPETPLEPNEHAKKVQWIKQWFKEYNTFAADKNPAGPRPLRKELDQAVAWRKKYDLPVWLGEFGAYSKGDMESRVKWTTFMRIEAEARGFPWAYWEFCAGFGVYDQGSRRWNEGLLGALVPGE